LAKKIDNHEWKCWIFNQKIDLCWINPGLGVHYQHFTGSGSRSRRTMWCDCGCYNHTGLTCANKVRLLNEMSITCSIFVTCIMRDTMITTKNLVTRWFKSGYCSLIHLMMFE
jgi:hypothetical protein